MEGITSASLNNSFRPPFFPNCGLKLSETHKRRISASHLFFIFSHRCLMGLRFGLRTDHASNLLQVLAHYSSRMWFCVVMHGNEIFADKSRRRHNVLLQYFIKVAPGSHTTQVRLLLPLVCFSKCTNPLHIRRLHRERTLSEKPTEFSVDSSSSEP